MNAVCAHVVDIERVFVRTCVCRSTANVSRGSRSCAFFCNVCELGWVACSGQGAGAWTEEVRVDLLLVYGFGGHAVCVCVCVCVCVRVCMCREMWLCGKLESSEQTFFLSACVWQTDCASCGDATAQYFGAFVGGGGGLRASIQTHESLGISFVLLV